MVQENAAAAVAGNPGGKKRNRNRNKKNKNKAQQEPAAAASPPPTEEPPTPEAPTAPLPKTPEQRSRSGSDEVVAAPVSAGKKNKKNKAAANDAEINGHAAQNGGSNSGVQSEESRREALVKNLAMDVGSSVLFSGANWFQLQDAERVYHEAKAAAVAAPSNGNGRAPAASSDSDDIDFFDDDDAPARKPKMVKPEPKAAPASKKQQQKKEGGKKQQQQQGGKKAQKQQQPADADDSSDEKSSKPTVAAVSNTACKNPANAERSFVMLKPDAVHRGLMGDIVRRLEGRGFKLVAAKFMKASESLLRKHYADLSKKGFFGELVRYMASGPVVPMVWEGLNVVKTVRVMLGETNPQASKPGTIRGDFCIDVGRNIIHASDSVEAAQKEIGMWFASGEVAEWKPAQIAMIYEDEEEEQEVDGLAALAGAPNAELSNKVKKLESENKNLKKITDDLKKLVITLEGRVNSLEKGGSSSAAAKPAAKEEDEDEDVDLFGSDSDEEEDAEKVRIREERLKAYHEKKSKKPALIAKTSVLLDCKPWDDETDMDAMLKEIKTITKEGLVWGASKLVPVGYGINKLQVMCVVEDEKVSIDELCEQITDFEDYVQSVDIAAMSKI